jgi:hypothetical protein
MTSAARKKKSRFWKNHADSIRGTALEREYNFDVKLPENVMILSRRLPPSNGQFYGQPFKLEPWEKQYFGHLFG